MQMPTQATVISAVRHGVSVIGTGITIASMLAFIPADKVQPAINTLQALGTDLEKVFGDAALLFSIIGPSIVAIAIKFAGDAVSLKSQVLGVREAAPHDLLNAVAKNSPGALAIATAALPGVQVTVSGAAAPALRTLAADEVHPDIVKASLTAPTVAPPVSRAQKE